MSAEWGRQRAPEGAIRSASAESMDSELGDIALGRADRDRSARRLPHSAAGGRGARSPRHAAVLLACLALVGFSSTTWAPEDIVFKAMRDELARSMERLRLDTLPAPYFIA